MIYAIQCHMFQLQFYIKAVYLIDYEPNKWCFQSCATQGSFDHKHFYVATRIHKFCFTNSETIDNNFIFVRIFHRVYQSLDVETPKWCFFHHSSAFSPPTFVLFGFFIISIRKLQLFDSLESHQMVYIYM